MRIYSTGPGSQPAASCKRPGGFTSIRGKPLLPDWTLFTHQLALHDPALGAVLLLSQAVGVVELILNKGECNGFSSGCTGGQESRQIFEILLCGSCIGMTHG